VGFNLTRRHPCWVSNLNSPPKLPNKPKRAASFEPAVAKAFGQAVRELRVKVGFAQDEFALLANVDRSYYGKLERGERQPSLTLMLRIASGLGLSGTDLMAHFEAALETKSVEVKPSGKKRSVKNGS
jgi:XRE family transcriptional regulator, regulator of sulfur utilization